MKRTVCAALIVTFAAVLLSCTGGGGGGEKAASESSPVETTMPTTTTCPPVGEPPSAPPPGSDPYAVQGARQIPGPAMTTTTLPATPVSVVVFAPPNPDANVAAVQPDGVPAATTAPPPDVPHEGTACGSAEPASGDDGP